MNKKELLTYYDNELGRLKASIDAEYDEAFKNEYRKNIKKINKIIKKLKNEKK
tara:strand:+ start:262 stop:420 length:159 start_codon:yes stop_codon:yes gene_type:complete